MKLCLWVFTVAFCLHSAVAEAAVPKKASVLLLQAKAEEFSDNLQFPGRVRSRVNDVMTSEIEGKVIKIEKPLGSKVKKGDVILVLQNTDPVYRYAPIRLRSLSSGYLTSLDVTLMAKVERNQKLFTVTDPQNLLVEVEIPARDLTSLHQGMKGEFRIDPAGPESVPVEIEGLSPAVDLASGTATAELRPLEKVDQLRQGQLGQISLKTNLRKTFVVPESAIVYRDDKSFLRVFENGKVQRRPIALGRRVGGNYEIAQGLKGGEQVITRTSRFVADGEEVEIQKEKSGAN